MLVIEVNMANTSIAYQSISLLQFMAGRYSWCCRPTSQPHDNQGGVAVGFDPTVDSTRLDSLQWEWAFRAAHVYT
jgi:hypothetical protein